ncbi:AUR protein Kinase [Gigaspora margarita]|uniref:Aurora kinase n=1 Tax=Gigaspora margarita TaxID=4874 RepID=A0A8H3WYJ5_GIGMA|nr:AUR protein Kinase [Gigaspora margarita]
MNSSQEQKVNKENLKCSQNQRTILSTLSMNDFEIVRQIGKGKYGHVYLAIYKASGYIVALKILLKQELQHEKLLKQLKREVEIQGNLDHPNILKLYGSFQDDNHIVMILEFAQYGTLYDFLKRSQRITEGRSARYIAQIVRALQFIHQKHIIHRDIKPENLLVGRNGEIKLADFGWATYAPDLSSTPLTTVCGTLDYLAPEMVRRLPYNENVDVWALGILCYELLVGVPPFEAIGFHETCRRIVCDNVNIPDHVSSEARNFILMVLQKIPFCRPSLEDILNHPWIRMHNSMTTPPSSSKPRVNNNNRRTFNNTLSEIRYNTF